MLWGDSKKGKKYLPWKPKVGAFDIAFLSLSLSLFFFFFLLHPWLANQTCATAVTTPDS